jgi:acetyl-CoA carboxylase carboxyltransferase component
MPRFDESHQMGPPPIRLQVERPRFPQAGPFPLSEWVEGEDALGRVGSPGFPPEPLVRVGLADAPPTPDGALSTNALALLTRAAPSGPNLPGVTTLALRALAPGAVSARVESLGGRRVVLIDIEAAVHRGALSSAACETLTTAANTAREERLPLVGYISSSGADIVEGMAALHGWGQAARAIADCSGVVPVLFAVTGPAVSGPALLLGLADHVVMTQDAYAFVSGPIMVAEFTGVVLDADELGGARTHSRFSGAATMVVADRAAASDALAELLAYLPDHNDEEPPAWPSADPVNRPTPELRSVLPASATGSYDVRRVMQAIVDDGALLELRAQWAPNLVTALAAIGGRPVGILGNQPLALAGTLDIPASQKGARFVSFCDAFNLPIVTLVDTPGFYPGKDLEWRGMIRHGAQLVFAYGRASVPRVGVILRKSYGGAYIVMDSKRMGNDLCLAWPTAELAVMGAGQASAVLMRRAEAEEVAAYEADYSERLLNPYVAADRGYVDAVIDPADTRAEVARALAALDSKRERLQPRKHDNTPL